jgi:hypothetical protein
MFERLLLAAGVSTGMRIAAKARDRACAVLGASLRGLVVAAAVGLFSIVGANPFYASPVPDGELAIKIHPTEGWGSGTTSIVTFGMPFPRGSVRVEDLPRIRLLNAQRQEVPVYVEALTPWRHAVDQSKNGTSLRVVRLQFQHSPNVSHPNFETFYVEWGRNARNANRTNLVDPRNSWHMVTNGSFLAADNVREPNVFAVLPAQWLSRGLLRVGQMQPFDAEVSDARDSPTVMDATAHYPGYREQQYAMKNFFYTAINEFASDTPPTPERQMPYRTDFDTWLYDRASTFYALYYRSGSFKALREAVRNAEFYRLQLYPAGTLPGVAVGAFKLKVPALEPSNPRMYVGSNATMYSYGEPLAHIHWTTGDNAMFDPIKWVAKVHEDGASEPVRWAASPGSVGYTERHAAFRLMAHVMAYEMFGDSALVIGKTYSYKDRMLEMMANLRWHQDGADGQIPANRVDGALWKDGRQQQEGATGTFVAAA